jgi:hypothetical protein
VIAFGWPIGFRLSAISLQFNEFPTSGFTSSDPRLSIRLSSAVHEKPEQTQATKGQRHPDALAWCP